VRSPCAVATEDGGVLCLYAGDDGGRTHLFSAWLPSSGTGLLRSEWQRLGPTLRAGRPGDADAAGCDHPSLVRVGRRRWLWYTARDGAGEARSGRISVASSVAGEPWARHGVVLGRGAPGQPDELAAESPAGSLRNPDPDSRALVELLYTGVDAHGATRALRARSTDAVTFDRLGPLTGTGIRDATVADGPEGTRWLAAAEDGALSVGPLGWS